MSSIYKIDKNDKVFIDTNILIFLFSPDFVSSKEYQIDKYSAIYEKLIENECALYINSHVVSEFINTCLRIDFDKNVQNGTEKKDFKINYRGSMQYHRTLSLILSKLKEFTSFNVFQLDDNFTKFEIFQEYQNNKEADFNDLIIASMVINNDLKLLSDDKDFQEHHNINTNWYLV